MISARFRAACRVLLYGSGLLVGLSLTFLAADWLWPLPLPKAAHIGTLVQAAQGQPLRAFSDQGIWRYSINREQVSPLYLQSLLAYEDRWFYQHPGINPLALLRAFWQNLRSGRTLSGGSTLTMQVARILDPHPRSLSGKFRQVFRALQLEYHLDKSQILDIYLQRAPFGGVIEGVEAASYSYLGKSASTLSLAEAALLAVLPQAPSRLRPDRNPEAAQKARDKVLERLQQQGQISRQQLELAKLERVSQNSFRLPNHAPLLAERLRKTTTASRIQTSIDYNLQLGLESLVQDYVSRLPDGSSAAVVVVENSSLLVKAYLGCGDFANPRRFGHLDMVQAIRSPGSTLKPLLYGLAMDAGLIHSESLLTDSPRLFSEYRPGNFGEGFSGPVSVRQALQRSLNVPAVQVLEALEPANFASRLQQAGLNLKFPANGQANLAMILGGVGTQLDQLLGLYTALANGGLAGQLRYQPSDPLVQKRLLSPQSAWIIRDLLSSGPMPDRVRSSHFQRGELQLAWKTGTSYGFRDAWALGVSPEYSLGVWIGRPDSTPMPGHYGLVTAAPLLFSIANRLPQNRRFEPPIPGVEQQSICWPLGRKFDPAQPELCHRKLDAWLIDQQTPPTLPELDLNDYSSNPLQVRVDRQTGQQLGPDCLPGQGERRWIAFWPKSLDPWLPLNWRRRALVPPLAANCQSRDTSKTLPLKIIGVRDNQQLHTAGFRTQSLSVKLSSQGGVGSRFWLINQKFLYQVDENQSITHDFTEPGTYQLTLIDQQGNSDSLSVQVVSQPP